MSDKENLKGNEELSLPDFNKIMDPPTPLPESKEEQIRKAFGIEKEKKLDRQLRLWGIHGQAEIDKANVLLLNASPVGCEVLKNIILPGFGRFTIVDDRNVSPRDLGNNFYVTHEDLGKSLAQACTKNLTELNPDCKGKYVKQKPADFYKMGIEGIKGYNYIIASQMESYELVKLSELCKANNTCLIVVRSYGFCGYVRVCGNVHTIVESKLDNPVEDLRLTNPWDDLQKFCDIQEFEKMNERDFTHTPFIVILVKVLKQWKQQNNGKLPSNTKEKEAFKDLIRKNSRASGFETNFQEALGKAFKSYVIPDIGFRTLEVLEHPNAKEENLTKESKNFWVMVYALKKFFEKEGEKKYFPLPGIIPDMHSDTDRFIRLQSLYRRKHRKDVADLTKYLQEICKKLGKEMPSDYEVAFFCKNALNLRVNTYPTIGEELNPKKINKESFMDNMWQVNPAFIYYFCMRAADEFKKKNGKFPGEKMDDDLQKESKELYEIMLKLFKDLGVDRSNSVWKDELLQKYAYSFTRFGASELHNISSLVGGIAAQEICKLITSQRLPLDNTFIYDGISSQSCILKI